MRFSKNLSDWGDGPKVFVDFFCGTLRGEEAEHASCENKRRPGPTARRTTNLSVEALPCSWLRALPLSLAHRRSRQADRRD